MSEIIAAGRRFEIETVVFDKDGTLVDFDHLWAPRTVRWAARLEAETGVPRLANALYRAVGYDAEKATATPDGPIAVGSMNDVYALAAGVLFQKGYDWHEGYSLVVGAAAETLSAPAAAAEVRPRGDVAGALRRLHAAGLRLAIATNDERALTEAMLRHLGVAHLVTAMVCGDDGLLPKPDAAGLQRLAAQLDTSTARMAMVGDSATDMLAGRNAGVAACIGVAGGAGKRETLARYADVVVDGIDEIGIADS